MKLFHYLISSYYIVISSRPQWPNQSGSRFCDQKSWPLRSDLEYDAVKLVKSAVKSDHRAMVVYMADRNWLEAFLCRSAKLCFRDPSDKSLSAIYERSADNRFSDILTRSNRSMYPLLPPERSQHCTLQKRSHNFHLPTQRWSDHIRNSRRCRHSESLADLDLSAAFDCIDDDILLMRLEKTFGIDELPLASFIFDSVNATSWLIWNSIRY